ncbi:hypothetical protein, partial [Acidocella sp.]|uniref:hypothetical protein n=1 Tax=Acidocella sp. TaxID=50710 RepID=UPI00262AFD64
NEGCSAPDPVGWVPPTRDCTIPISMGGTQRRPDVRSDQSTKSAARYVNLMVPICVQFYPTVPVR